MKLKFDYLTKCLLLLLVVMGMSSLAMAQRTIKGTVTDAQNGDPLIGANILVIGTSTGTITDIDGTYELRVPDGAKEIEITYTGYAAQKVALGAGNVYDVAMSAGAILDEVVVIGYGSVKKSDATGAVSSVTEKDFNQGIVTSPEQLIQGRAAGVQITNNNGEPGGGINVRIRGTSSVRSGNGPLYVVDGVPLGGDATSGGGFDVGVGRQTSRNPLNFLNPNDIASIDILKDASATAIYGSRGANGVVIITTKSGQAGKNVLDYGYSIGFSTITKKVDVLGRDEFLNAYESFNGAAARATLDLGANTDWQDEVLQTGISHNHNLSFGGGDKSGDYRFSLGYLDQEGIIKTSGLKRLSGRFNANKKFWNDRLKIGTQVTVSNTHDDAVPISENVGFEGDLWSNALKANPTQPVRTANDSLFQFSNTEPNPVAMIELVKDFTNTLRALGNINAEIEIIEGLSFKTLVGFDRSSSSRKSAWSRDLLAGTSGPFGKGFLYLSDIDVNNKLWENYFTYTKDFGSVDFNGTLGYSYQEFNYNTKRSELTNFRTSDLDLMINNFASANQAGGKGIVGTNSSQSVDELQSYFGRINLGFLDKYLVTATLRADGSTRFGGDNKYGYFPAFAVKWRAIQEEFIPDFFSDLGVRIGYGVTGNQEIPHNLYQERQRYNDWDINQNGDVTGGGIGSVAFANPGLKWETTVQTNIGVDFGFANNRVSGSLDFYHKNTNDLLIQVTSAQPAVNDFVWKNLDADVVNQGVELTLNLVAVDKPNFDWNINGNVAYNKNEVKNFSGLINTGEINGQGLTGAFAQRIAEGQPLFAFYVREFDGYDDNGITIYKDGDVQRFTGASPIPKVTAGLTNSFRFGDLDFNFFFNGQFGHYIYNNTANALFTAGSLANGRNVTKDVVGNGESNLNAPDVSTRFLEKGDFVRLQNVSIGYSLKPNIKNVSSIRFSITGQNLFVITGYSGQDPEVNTNKALNGVPSLGIDYSSYPRSRTILIGANITF
ncbi:MAG: SusC/RagA family TonB-linked outer membrane protein [Lewinellaceae bacterium]|nr:SusC/RagA family TonB-linked outer membrane protein [Lewinellaceae bacterium]